MQTRNAVSGIMHFLHVKMALIMVTSAPLPDTWEARAFNQCSMAISQLLETLLCLVPGYISLTIICLVSVAC